MTRETESHAPESPVCGQEDFAGKAGVHRTYVRSIELGKVSVGIEVAMQLAAALGKRLSELVEQAE